MSIEARTLKHLPTGEAIVEYTLTNKLGAYVSILNLGGVVTKIVVPDRDGKLGDVNLGFDDPEVYLGDSGSMGALIGRFGNRIGGAEFELEGKTYKLGKNDGENNLHGGPKGFNVQIWQSEAEEKIGVPTLTLRLTSPDGDQGFPGKLETSVEYTFDDNGTLGIHYHAVTDAPTLVNLTNHCYFNLDGHDAGTVEDLELQIFADYATEVTNDLIPTGKIIPVSETNYDFSTAKRVGDVLAATGGDPLMSAAGGVDFNYCMGRDRETKTAAMLYSPKTGRTMEVVTDQPGVQCYTGQGLHQVGKGGVQYKRFSGLCLETQHYPDGIHHPHFPSVVLRPQDVYDTVTEYRFGVRK